MFMIFASCRKNDNPRIPTLTRVPVPYIKADPTKSQSISVQNPASFNQTFSIDMFFPSDVPAKQVDLVAIINGVNTSVKTLQAGITAFPATVNVTGAQLLSLFGSIVLGDNITFGLDITTQNGSLFQAFPALGIGYGSGVAREYTGATNVTPLAAGGGVVYQLTYGALCAYDPTIFQGNFVVVKDDWQDTNPGDIIVFTQIDATHFSFIYPSVLLPKPIIVTVTTTNNTVSIAQQSIGSAWSPAFGYGPQHTAPTASATGSLAPCDKTISLSMTYGYAAGPFGGNPYTFKLKKQ